VAAAAAAAEGSGGGESAGTGNVTTTVAATGELVDGSPTEDRSADATESAVGEAEAASESTASLKSGITGWFSRRKDEKDEKGEKSEKGDKNEKTERNVNSSAEAERDDAAHSREAGQESEPRSGSADGNTTDGSGPEATTSAGGGDSSVGERRSGSGGNGEHIGAEAGTAVGIVGDNNAGGVRTSADVGDGGVGEGVKPPPGETFAASGIQPEGTAGSSTGSSCTGGGGGGRGGSAGGGGGGSRSAGGGGGGSPSRAGLTPSLLGGSTSIFKTLTQRIKSLELNQSLFEHYVQVSREPR
jgi:hypothetical protein